MGAANCGTGRALGGLAALVLALAGAAAAPGGGASSSAAGVSACVGGPCYPGRERCKAPPRHAPKFHLMDQRGCNENDPNGPVFDPVHGVVHHFFQDHLAAPPGAGPVYGHFVSKDFVHWAQLPAAIWNGLDASVWPPRATPYDEVAIYTGSAVVVDGAGPGGRGPGVVNIYPGLCNKATMPECKTGTLLAQAVPADYAGDALLTNWTKPAYNPIVQNTERDPSTPWRMPNGEWRLVTFSSMYGTASDADMLAGTWYELQDGKALGEGAECPSFYPLPPPTPGHEVDYDAAALPTHVHKQSRDGADWWRLGVYDGGHPRTGGAFAAAPGWEDLFHFRRIDQGNYYASKDNLYPDAKGNARRINWGWARVPPASAQTLPRAVTFNAAARCLEQAPIEELKALRGAVAFAAADVRVGGTPREIDLAPGVAAQSEVVLRFGMPASAGIFGLRLAGPEGELNCTVAYQPPPAGPQELRWNITVGCGQFLDTLTLLRAEREIEVRVFVDNTFVEAYFQGGRVAMTAAAAWLSESTRMELVAASPVTLVRGDVYPMKSIWVPPEVVRSAARVFPALQPDVLYV